jgi:hypothetical protein
MAELTPNASPPDCIFGTKAEGTTRKSTSQEDDGTSPLNPQTLIFVRYLDHVFYNRTSALAMKPQTREAIGWLTYDCELYIILTWDRDAGPPTLHGGDPKASGLVLLKGDVLELQLLKVSSEPLQKKSDWALNRKQPIQGREYAFRPTERKTHSSKGGKTL